MRVLVTGGTGFLGGSLVERLVSRGDKVRVLVRRTSDTAFLRSLGVEMAEGDVTDRASVMEACQGVEIVYHAAAFSSDWGAYDHFHAVNVEGTQNVIDACREARIQRLVHVSTQSVVFAFDDHHGTDESYPIPPRHRDFYSATKAEAERRVLDAHGGALFTTAIRPHIIWGPRDTKFLPRIEALARKGQLVLVGGGRSLCSISYIDNVVDALLLGAERDAAGGEAFFIVDREPVEVRHFVGRLCEAVGAPLPTLSVPYRLAFGSAIALEWVWRLLGRQTPPPISRYGVALLSRNTVFRWEKAHRLLGYTPGVEFQEGMRRLMEWRARNPPRD
ncbi:MAG: NAD-dependent epimerase/dehydratase family protein [Deltaproteobacteria bacterium]|nr:NAD-dependent epimerase/dehydratase family protein [Deltaproteobacteria bacterium]